MLLTNTVRYESKAFGIMRLPIFIELVEPNDDLTKETKDEANKLIEKIGDNSIGIHYEDIVSLVDSYYEVIRLKNPHRDSLDAIKML